MGKKYGRLTIIKNIASHKTQGRMFVCQCDCGNIINVCWSRLNNGITKSCGCLATESKKSRSNEKHYFWKGDKVGKNAVHEWLRKHYPKPDKCTQCGKITERLELANLTGIYTRNIKDYKYLCCSCHKKLDRSGIKHPLCKFKEEDYKIIKTMLDANISSPKIAKHFGVHKYTIYRLKWNWINK